MGSCRLGVLSDRGAFCPVSERRAFCPVSERGASCPVSERRPSCPVSDRGAFCPVSERRAFCKQSFLLKAQVARSKTPGLISVLRVAAVLPGPFAVPRAPG